MPFIVISFSFFFLDPVKLFFAPAYCAIWEILNNVSPMSSSRKINAGSKAALLSMEQIYLFCTGWALTQWGQQLTLDWGICSLLTWARSRPSEPQDSGRFKSCWGQCQEGCRTKLFYLIINVQIVLLKEWTFALNSHLKLHYKFSYQMIDCSYLSSVMTKDLKQQKWDLLVCKRIYIFYICKK